MDEERFRDMDAAWMKRLESERSRPDDAGYANVFAAEVERKIRARDAAPRRSPAHAWWLAPAFALTIAALAPVLVRPAAPQRVQLAAAAAEATISDEIALLKELGAWTDEDDREAGTDDAAEIELSAAASPVRLA